MSLNAQITITSDNATPAIAKLMEETKPERLAEICRQPLQTFWQMHLKNFPRLAGKFASFPDTGFGERAARSVNGFIQNDGVLLRADALGLRLRYEGGTIEPVNAKTLCFPVTSEAYGKSVYDFGYVAGVKNKDVSQKIRDNFAFAKTITFQPNPMVVPSDDEFQEVAMAAMERSLN